MQKLVIFAVVHEQSKGIKTIQQATNNEIYLNFGYEEGVHLGKCALSLYIYLCLVPARAAAPRLAG